jgi:hypothetical protein
MIIFTIANSFVEPLSSEEKQEMQEKRRQAAKRFQYGEVKPALVCPHCQEKGQIRTKHLTQKKGISGSKAAGAVLTAGTSVLATGLSRRETNTQAHCDCCDSTWFF